MREVVAASDRRHVDIARIFGNRTIERTDAYLRAGPVVRVRSSGRRLATGLMPTCHAHLVFGSS